VIKIRYADLPGGLHVRAVARGRDTIIYLLPGLTVPQRRAALNRARASARMGHGPRLPGAAVACAVAADRAWTTVRNAATAMRVHPAVAVPLIVITISAAVAYVVLASVLVGGGSAPGRSLQAGWPGYALGVPAATAPRPSPAIRPRDSGGLPGNPVLPGGPSAGHSGAPAPKPSGGGHPSPGRPSPSPSPDPQPTPTAHPLPLPGAVASG
jgi:hypothetical protein